MTERLADKVPIPEGTPLTKEEVWALPIGTRIIVVWSGGNGPHRYTFDREGDEFPPVAKSDHEPSWSFDYEGKNLDGFVGQEPMHTRVWLDA